jgi:hypothetical protein
MEPGQIEMGVGPNNGSVAKQGIEEAKRIGDKVRRRIFAATDQGKASLVDRADAWLGGVTAGVLPDGAKEKAMDLVETLRTRSTEELIDDVQFEARRRPTAFVLGALALGFIAGRVLVDVGSES